MSLLPRLLQDGISSDQSNDVDLDICDLSTCGDWKQDSAAVDPAVCSVVGCGVAMFCLSSLPEPERPGLSTSEPGTEALPEVAPAVQVPRVPDRLSMAGAVLALLPAAGARLLLLPLMRSSDISSSFGMLALPLANDALAESAVAVMAVSLRSCCGLGHSSCDLDLSSPAPEGPGALPPMAVPLAAPAAAGGSGCKGEGTGMFTTRCLCTGDSKGDGVATEAADLGDARHDVGARTEGGAPEQLLTLAECGGH